GVWLGQPVIRVLLLWSGLPIGAFLTFGAFISYSVAKATHSLDADLTVLALKTAGAGAMILSSLVLFPDSVRDWCERNKPLDSAGNLFHGRGVDIQGIPEMQRYFVDAGDHDFARWFMGPEVIDLMLPPQWVERGEIMQGVKPQVEFLFRFMGNKVVVWCDIS